MYEWAFLSAVCWCRKLPPVLGPHSTFAHTFNQHTHPRQPRVLALAHAGTLLVSLSNPARTHWQRVSWPPAFIRVPIIPQHTTLSPGPRTTVHARAHASDLAPWCAIHVNFFSAFGSLKEIRLRRHAAPAN
ncbi:hypothetical protein EXIGLDRAFT_355784 [Exidia glandulosa HHB12029]|uniref:Uncharacterized protein n=1 Tax=Exidia glandulosa HHB12029 TaxID=1314781 RepID=A0A165CAJ3_EXIGL|nr:hypothetical protein EXIGLDRAFT_355784 [Exidia glandulosa HHB12029]